MLSEAQKAAGWTEVFPDEVCPPPFTFPPDITKRVRVRLQMEEAKATSKVHCACGELMPLHRSYKCLYCAEWYCATCAEIHFGLTRAEYDAKRELHAEVSQ